MSKKDAAVYLKAAEALTRAGNGVGCCYAIDIVEDGGYFSALQGRFRDAFKPSVTECGDWWWRLYEDQTPRILALCFAAAMAESGDL